MPPVVAIPVRIGVSSCLLGAEVRFDGGHKRDSFLVSELGRHVEWVPVCPELEVGMGVPREPVRLVRFDRSAPDDVRMVGVGSGRDWTEEMRAFARHKVELLDHLYLSGYVLKSKSPSCGMERVKIYPISVRGPAKEDRGLFAAALMEHFPLLPMEDESRLSDPMLRENFIERVFCHHRWLLFRSERFTPRRLGMFHQRHKDILLAHSEAHLRRLGRIVASSKGRPAAGVAGEYARVFFEALAVMSKTANGKPSSRASCRRL